jgi:hypothetical protein
VGKTRREQTGVVGGADQSCEKGQRELRREEGEDGVTRSPIA